LKHLTSSWFFLLFGSGLEESSGSKFLDFLLHSIRNVKKGQSVGWLYITYQY
jgi:hypothetical protein